MMGNIDQQTHSIIEMQAELNGPGLGWIDIAADVQRVPSIQFDYGISGAGPLDLVAPTGSMTFALNNGPGNSANLLGYYSPGHANCRSGFAIGMGIRFVYRINGTGTAYYKFNGTLDSIDPISGLYGDRKTLCTVVDWMDEAAIFRPNVATQLSKRVDEILTSLVAAVPRQPRGTDFDTGDSTFTYALDTDLNEADAVLTVLQRLAQSEYGRIYIKGDTAQGGILTFESRSARFVPTSLATFNDTMISVSAPYERNLLINRVKATTHPRTVGTVTTDILFTLTQVSPSIHSIAAGATSVIEGDYTDPANRSARIGGTDMVTPVATTDYLFNTAADGSGTNITSFAVVTASYGSNRVKYSIYNSFGATAYVRLLQARGRTLLDYTPVDSIATDTASITSYGERQLALDMPYQSAVPTAQTVGDYLLSAWSSPSAVSVGMPLIPPNNTDLATIIAREPGDPITIVESVTGLSSIFYINHVSMRLEDFQTFNVEWILQKALSIPTIRSSTSSSVIVDNTSHAVSMPSGIVSGDLLISFFTVEGSPTITWPAGWTEFATRSSGVVGKTSIAYRQADGTEGSTITVTTTAPASQSTHCTYRIIGAADPATRPPEASTFDSQTTIVSGGSIFGVGILNIDCPSLTPTGGVKQYLWLSAGTVRTTAGLNGNLYTIPTNYGNTKEANTDPVGIHFGWPMYTADRNARLATEDPGYFGFNSFTVGVTFNWMTFTVAVHPR